MSEGETAGRLNVMGWREALALQSLCGKAAQSLAEIGTFGHMSSADRIAMARELLEGTDWHCVPAEPSVAMLQDGHHAGRMARVGGVGGMTIEAQTRRECAREAAAWRAMVRTANEEPTP